MVVILGSYNPNLEQRTEPEPQSRDEAEDYGAYDMSACAWWCDILTNAPSPTRNLDEVGLRRTIGELKDMFNHDPERFERLSPWAVFLAQRLFCLQTWTPERLDGKHSAMQKLEIPQGLAAELRQGEGCATAGCPPWPESGRRCLCHSTRLVSEGEDQWVEQHFTNGLRCSENQLLAHQWWLAIYICPCLWPSPCREDLVATRACSLACRTSHTALSRAKYQRKWPAWLLLLKSDGFWIQLLPPRGRIEVGQKRHWECKCKLSFCIIWCGTAIVHLGQFQLRHCVFEGPRRWGNGANRLKLQLPGATQLQMGKLGAVVTQDRPGPEHRCFRWTTWKSMEILDSQQSFRRLPSGLRRCHPGACHLAHPPTSFVGKKHP